ncbi:probable cyclic nucleotide-gated ion channel 10 [Pistacia vera]|uniref:probable cyclic nucleotide-gated ion channel 10 n=1 Tax=Pistacia vera TaxID=55513 RepID=UPI001263C095|nr:probable cyclic nucleotide-gated ion channel 10 [Pistacia vera]
MYLLNGPVFEEQFRKSKSKDFALFIMSHQSQPQASDPEIGSDPDRGSISYKLRACLQACYDWLPSPLKKTLKWMSKKFEIGSTWGCGLYIAAYMIVIVIHPLHYYAYVIKQDQNCLEIDNELYATIAPVLFFNAYMLLYTPYFFEKVIAPGNSKTVIGHFIFTQILVLFMTLTVLPDLTTGTEDRIFLTTANLFLFGYILLVIGLSLTIKNATESNAVFGALWYSFAIDRILACWREDYFTMNNFNPHSFVCREKHKNIEELNCHKIKKIASEITEFGIFNEALRYHIVRKKRQFLKKILYCFRWGLQALSCFGQNLTPSTFIMENIFVVSVVIYSTVLFVFLIGNMQEYLKP